MAADVERRGELDQPAVRFRIEGEVGQLLVGRRGVGLHWGEQQVDVLQHGFQFAVEALRVEQHALVIHAGKRPSAVDQAAQRQAVFRSARGIGIRMRHGGLYAAVDFPVGTYRAGIRHAYA
ncbi:hypothetical protein D9M70_603570 [compost metagenome]